MPGWSALRPMLVNLSKNGTASTLLKRNMSEHRTFPMQPSRFQWHKFKDLLHFYVMIGVLPLAALTTYINVFIGPATLSEIPEDYEPKYWEYHRHPITRFMARYLVNNPQQEYEKYLHYVYEEEDRSRMRALENEIKEKMKERKDYQAYYYRPIMAKYHRQTKEYNDYTERIEGD